MMSALLLRAPQPPSRTHCINGWWTVAGIGGGRTDAENKGVGNGEHWLSPYGVVEGRGRLQLQVPYARRGICRQMLRVMQERRGTWHHRRAKKQNIAQRCWKTCCTETPGGKCEQIL